MKRGTASLRTASLRTVSLRTASLLAASLLAASLLTGCGSGKTRVVPENGVSDMPLEAILDQMLESAEVHLGSWFDARVPTPAQAAYAMGMDTFSQTYADALIYEPVISSTSFVLLLFRLDAGGDTAAFERELRENAHPECRPYVQVDFVDTAVNGQIILFLASEYGLCPQPKREALLKAFWEADPMGYDPADYQGASQAMMSTKSVPMAQMMEQIRQDCPYLEAVPEPLTAQKAAEWGLTGAEISAVGDSSVSARLAGETPYLCGVVRLKDETTLQRFTALLHLTLAGVIPNGKALIVYKGDVIGFCAAADALTAYDTTAAMMRRYGLADYLGNFSS